MHNFSLLLLQTTQAFSCVHLSSLSFPAHQTHHDSGSAAAPVSAAAGAEGGGATATSGATIRGGGVEERGKSDPADVWEFTEGDLDNNAAAKYDSDDDWSYASVSKLTESA